MRLAYSKLIESNKNKEISDNLLKARWYKWTSDNAIECSFEDYIQSLSDINYVTNVPKLRSFQYRLLMNIIVTNKQLYAWGKAQNNLCTFCKSHKETVLHLFVECDLVQELWIDTWQDVKERFPCDHSIDLTVKCTLMSRPVAQKGHVYNLISLIVKQYIYRQRCLSKGLK